jgi:hypothetical protein
MKINNIGDNMKTILNILTFGLYNQVQELRTMIKNLEADMDIQSAVEEEINRGDVLTHDNFCPSDFDITTYEDVEDCVKESDFEEIMDGILHDKYGIEPKEES